MSRTTLHQSPRLERLESRELLSGPTADQQYMLYLINQARTNPAAAAQRYTQNLDADTQATVGFYNVNLNQAQNTIASTPARQPLAWSDSLAQTATHQSQDEANMGQQTHTGADGSDLGTRLSRAGLTNLPNYGENTYAYAKSVDETMNAFMLDWGVPDHGHFNNLMQPGVSGNRVFNEVGIGIVGTNNKGLGPNVITQDYAADSSARPFLLGVVYNAKDGNNSYARGEGVGNVTIEADNLGTGTSSTVQSWDAGGYQMNLDPGQYRVTATENGQVVGQQNVTVGSSNVEVDFNLSQAPAPTPPAPPSQPPAPVTTSQPTNSQSQAPQTTNSSSSQAQPAQAVDAVFQSAGITSWQSWSAATGQKI